MAKDRYHFNLESLSFTEDKHGFRYWAKLLSRYLLAGIALAVISYIVFSYVAYTPRERRIAEDNALLREQLAQMKIRYQELSTVLGDLEQRDDNIYRTLFESEPVRSDAQKAAQEINKLYSKVKSEGKEPVVQETHGRLKELLRSSTEESKRFNRVVELAQNNQRLMASIPAVQPIQSLGNQHISAPFGVRIHPFYKVLKMHTGVDYASPVGTPVVATANGTVVGIHETKRGLGNHVEIDHGHGYRTLYAHLAKISVRRGQKVLRGSPIGQVGNTGMSMAPHLHYEVRHNGNPVDPLNYFFAELGPVELAALARNASQNGQTMD